MLSRLSFAQTQLPVTALGLDFEICGALASWPTIVPRRIVAHMPPGATQQKKRRPAAPPPDGVDGQIKKPGQDGVTPDAHVPQHNSGAHRPKKQETKKVAARRCRC